MLSHVSPQFPWMRPQRFSTAAEALQSLVLQEQAEEAAYLEVVLADTSVPAAILSSAQKS